MAKLTTGILLLVLLATSYTATALDDGPEEVTTTTAPEVTTTTTPEVTTTTTPEVTTTTTPEVTTTTTPEVTTTTTPEVTTTTTPEVTTTTTTGEVTTTTTTGEVTTATEETTATEGNTDVTTSTDGNTDVPTSTGTPTTTERPVLTGKALFEETGRVLADVKTSLKEFEGKLSPETKPDVKGSPLRLLGARLGTPSRSNAEVVARVNDFCVVEKEPCTTIRESLDAIETELGVLIKNEDTWSDTSLRRLESDAERLKKGVADMDTDLSSFDTAVAIGVVAEVEELVDNGAQVAEEQVDKYKKEESDSIVFVAVFGSLGGLMIVALVVSTVLFFTKKKSATKAKNKGYNQVREERIPVGDFITAHDEEPRLPRPGFSGSGTSPRGASPAPGNQDPYARADRDRRDPYARGTMERENRDPYARGYPPRNEPRSQFASGPSGGLPRNY